MNANEKELRAVLHHVNTHHYRVVVGPKRSALDNLAHSIFDPTTYLLRHIDSGSDVIRIRQQVINTIYQSELLTPDGSHLTQLGHDELYRLNALWQSEAPVNV